MFSPLLTFFCRIKNILKLEELLLSLLPKNLGFVPPYVLPLVDYSSWQPLMGIPKVTNGLKKISGKGKGKGLKRKTDDTMAISQTQLNSQVCLSFKLNCYLLLKCNVIIILLKRG